MGSLKYAQSEKFTHILFTTKKYIRIHAHVTLISIHLLGAVIPVTILTDFLLGVIVHPRLLAISIVMRILETFLGAAIIFVRV